jgi:pimeloyl-ACP methyl ester carboxylesterase
MGSTLRKGDDQVWGTGLPTVLSTVVSRLKTIKPEGHPHPDYQDDVWADGLIGGIQMIPGLWTIQLGYDGLLKRLESVLGRKAAIYRSAAPPAQQLDPPASGLIAFPYDWRLSNRVNADRLDKVLQVALPKWQGLDHRDARVTFICHSMGGLVARWFAQCCPGGSDMTRRIITIGTPHRGALRALDQLMHGARIGKGPFQLKFSEFARSLPSTYELLPEYACIQRPGSPAPDLISIADYGVENLQDLDSLLTRKGLEFLETLNEKPASTLQILPIVGTRQPTLTTMDVTGSTFTAVDQISEADEAGDGTVPRLSATPNGMETGNPVIHWTADKHGALQHNRSVLDQLEGALSVYPAHKGPGGADLSVQIDEFVIAGESIPVYAEAPGERTLSLEARVIDERGGFILTIPLKPGDGGHKGEVPVLPPGTYQVIVQGYRAASALVAPVTSLIAVLDAT